MLFEASRPITGRPFLNRENELSSAGVWRIEKSTLLDLDFRTNLLPDEPGTAGIVILGFARCQVAVF
tara:strand:- start:289 stop:489 length:201 start_codon:yes stop_codon:yes gene_type:complete